LTAHQPVYLPWLGLFHKIAISDLFCYFDIVQYQTKDYNNRNKVKTYDGQPWLSVPVDSKNHLEKKINEIKIIDNSWRKKHCKIIELAYKKSTYFDEYFDNLKKIIQDKNILFLSDLNFNLLIFFLNCLKIKTKVIKASDYKFSGKKSDLVLDMCKQLKVKKYVFGSQGKNYANKKIFKDSGFAIYFQEYKHPIYRQLHGKFVSNMCIIDLLFNEGEKSKDILMSGNITKLDLKD